MESLTQQNLNTKIQMIQTAIGIVAYDRLKAQKQIEIAEGNIRLCDLRITKLEAEQAVVQASLNDLKVDIANADEALAKATQEVDEVTQKLKKARKRK